MTYLVTLVDITQEGYLYVVVDFGNGWVEDFIFPDLTGKDDVVGTIRRVVSNHGAKQFHGDRRDPHIRLGGKDLLGSRVWADHLLGQRI